MLGIMKWWHREDPLTLNEAFRLLSSRHAGVRLILVGDGPLQSELKLRLQGLVAMVFCHGYVPFTTLLAWFGLADLFVHPVPEEPWGVSVNQALTAGLPVGASTGVGAAAELLRPHGCGQVFPAIDVALAHDADHTIGRFEAALAGLAHA